jgi:hypothetical protein
MIKIIDHYEFVLMSISLLNHLPKFDSLRLIHRIVYDVSTNQNNSLIEK